MLSYKEYKLLNESLYGAFNLGLKGHATVGGIVSDSSVNGTEAALEAESEEAIEEAKKGKKMKKKMIGDEDEVVKKVRVSDDDHDDEDDKEDHDDEDDKEDHDDDEDSDDSDDEGDEGDEDHDEDEEDEGDDDHEKSEKGREFAFMKKKSKKHMKKKSKKEWSEVMSDLEDILEGIDDEDALLEVKKGLQMMKKGMQKGVDGSKAHNDPKSQIDKSIEYHGSRGMKKHMGCGTKKCGKNMSESDAAWWDSVNGMLGASADQKGWDGWMEVGEVEQAVRESTESKKKLINEWWPFSGLSDEALDRLAQEYVRYGRHQTGSKRPFSDDQRFKELSGKDKIKLTRLVQKYSDIRLKEKAKEDKKPRKDWHTEALKRERQAAEQEEERKRQEAAARSHARYRRTVDAEAREARMARMAGWTNYPNPYERPDWPYG